MELISVFLPTALTDDVYKAVELTMFAIRAGAARCTQYLLRILRIDSVRVDYSKDTCLSVFKNLLWPDNMPCFQMAVEAIFIPPNDYNVKACASRATCHPPVLRDHLALVQSMKLPRFYRYDSEGKVAQEIQNCISLEEPLTTAERMVVLEQLISAYDVDMSTVNLNDWFVAGDVKVMDVPDQPRRGNASGSLVRVGNTPSC